MYKFGAILWPAHAPTARRRAAIVKRLALEHGWTTVTDADGLFVVDNDDLRWDHRRYVLPENKGVVLGTLFDSSARAPRAMKQLSPAPQSMKSAEAVLEHLRDDCWGRYVAFLRDGDVGHVFARDPSGQIHCYVRRFEDLVFVTSDVQFLVDVGVPLKINRAYVIAASIGRPLPGPETGFAHITELLPGQAERAHSATAEPWWYWDPSRLIHHQHDDSVEALSERWRDAVFRSTTGLASCHKHVLLMLSGGFDSSVVLGALARPDVAAAVSCYTGATEMPEADERDFARLAATLHGRSLHEGTTPTLDVTNVVFNGHPLSAEPIGGWMGQAKMAPVVDHARDIGADIVFKGDGGDEMFGSHVPLSAFIDAVRRHGLSPRSLSYLLFLSQAKNRSVWATLETSARALVGAVRPLEGAEPEPEKACLTSTALDEFDAGFFSPPWAQFEDGVSPAKRRRLTFLGSYFIPLNSYNASSPHLAHLSPLMQQPVLEIALRTPVYALAYGGTERGLARHAFKDLLPQEVQGRYWKSSPQRFTQIEVRGYTPKLIEELSGGRLAEMGVLDPDKLRIALEDRSYEKGTHNISLCADVEAWLRTAGEMTATKPHSGSVAAARTAS